MERDGLVFLQRNEFSVTVLSLLYVPPPKPKNLFPFFYTFLFLADYLSVLSLPGCKHSFVTIPSEEKNPKNPPGMQNMNCNDLSFSIHGSNKQLIYSGAGTCCGLIKTNVLLADHLLRGNKLTKDKLSCHAINWGKKNKNMPS